ncbi:MAG: response regulator [Chitinivibrionales bacterium]|nr:response regulator [Chitinivibrionales bacterium]
MAYTILVVDDSETILSVLERTLAMTKLPIDEILKAGNGKEALEILKMKWVDIVFTDINMPQMNGVEFVTVMHDHHEYCEIPVIVISTEGSQTRIEELRRKGIKGYLRKPFTPESIRDIIVSTLGGWDAISKY